MGNRANYILIEHGQAHIYFTRWGALTIPAVLLSGPEATLEYARQLTPDDTLLDSVWAEGGVLLDIDAHRALFWGGDTIARCSYLRRPLLAALPLLWPGWSISWALLGVAELARAIGWEIERVLRDEFDDTRFLAGDEAVVTEQQLLEALQADARRMILTIRWQTGGVSDYRFAGAWFDDTHSHTFTAIPYQVLSLGPRLLDLMRAQPTAALPKENNEPDPDEGYWEPEGAYVDEEGQTIWVGEDETLDPRYLEAIARRWPGWQVQGHVEGLVRQVQLSGRDPAALMVSEQQAIDELIDEVLTDFSINPMQLAQAILKTQPPAEREGVKFGVGFFNEDLPPLASQERRDVLKRLFEGALGHDKAQGTEEQ